jgi:PST family polysaccharide transporter
MQTLCNQNLLIRDIAATDDRTERASKVLTAARLQSLIGILSLLAVLPTLLLPGAGESGSLYHGIVVITVAAIFPANNAFKADFLARLDSRPLAAIEAATAIVSSTVTLIAVLVHAPLECLYCILPLTAAVSYWFSQLQYRSLQFGLTARFNRKYARELIKESLPTTVASLAYSVFWRVDQLLLGLYVTRWDLGQYSASARIADATNLISSTLIATGLPHLSKVKKENPAQFDQSMRSLFGIVIGAWLVCGISIAIFSVPIVQALFGTEYKLAGQLLAVYIWSGLATACSGCRSTFITVQKLLYLSAPISIASTLVSVAICLWLIPAYGVWGAAYATVATYGIASIGFSFVIPKLRPIALLPFQSLNLIGTIRAIKSTGSSSSR